MSFPGYTAWNPVMANGATGVTGATGTSTFTRQSVSVTTASLAPGAIEQDTVTMAKSANIFSVSCNNSAWVRIYCTSAARTADLGRSILNDPVPGSGCIFDGSTSSVITCSPVPNFYNLDATPNTNCYLSIMNLGSTTTSITTIITFVPEEV